MSLAEQLEATWPAQFVANYPWSFPSLEITHLLGLTVMFGGMVLLALRLLGMGRALSIPLLQRHILPGVGGVCRRRGERYLVDSVRSHQAHDRSGICYQDDSAAAGGAERLAPASRWAAQPSQLDVPVLSPPWVRVSAALSLVMWCGILAGGRLIAYYYAFEF